MLTKVGRRKPMLICTACGHPSTKTDDAAKRQLTISGSLFMLALAAVAGMAFFMTQMKENDEGGRQSAERMHREQAIVSKGRNALTRTNKLAKTIPSR
jgi:hypothetical protein